MESNFDTLENSANPIGLQMKLILKKIGFEIIKLPEKFDLQGDNQKQNPLNIARLRHGRSYTGGYVMERYVAGGQTIDVKASNGKILSIHMALNNGMEYMATWFENEDFSKGWKFLKRRWKNDEAWQQSDMITPEPVSLS